MSRHTSFAIITVIYMLAGMVGCLVFIALEPMMQKMWALLASDIAATIIVWGFGILFRNVSVYDPYWSVAPPIIYTAWAFHEGVCTLPVLLLLIAIWYWGIRLTCNWAYTFRGMAYEDWRYTKYRKSQPPLLFHLTNFFGLNMMPTVLVFVAMLPGFELYENTFQAGIGPTMAISPHSHTTSTTARAS